jgi:hypothetical protein
MTNVRERYNPVPMAANRRIQRQGLAHRGLSPNRRRHADRHGVAPDGVTAVTFINAVPVTAGIYVKLPCEFTVAGTVVQLAGGAAGTLFV